MKPENPRDRRRAEYFAKADFAEKLHAIGGIGSLMSTVGWLKTRKSRG